MTRSRYDDPLARAIYDARVEYAFSKALWSSRPKWPETREQMAALEHTGGNADMDLALISAKAARDFLSADSSTVERTAHNGQDAGSNPAPHTEIVKGD